MGIAGNQAAPRKKRQGGGARQGPHVPSSLTQRLEELLPNHTTPTMEDEGENHDINHHINHGGDDENGMNYGGRGNANNGRGGGRGPGGRGRNNSRGQGRGGMGGGRNSGGRVRYHHQYSGGSNS